MVKEYCDKCKAEIDSHERISKRVVKIIIPSPNSGYEYTVSITLCPECFSRIGIYKAVMDVAPGYKEEKEPAAVDKLLDIIREGKRLRLFVFLIALIARNWKSCGRFLGRFPLMTKMPFWKNTWGSQKEQTG